MPYATLQLNDAIAAPTFRFIGPGFLITGRAGKQSNRLDIQSRGGSSGKGEEAAALVVYRISFYELGKEITENYGQDNREKDNSREPESG